MFNIIVFSISHYLAELIKVKIIAIDQKNIKNIDEFNQIYEKQLSDSGKNNVVLLVKRGDYTMFVAIPLEQN